MKSSLPQDVTQQLWPHGLALCYMGSRKYTRKKTPKNSFVEHLTGMIRHVQITSCTLDFIHIMGPLHDVWGYLCQLRHLPLPNVLTGDTLELLHRYFDEDNVSLVILSWLPHTSVSIYTSVNNWTYSPWVHHYHMWQKVSLWRTLSWAAPTIYNTFMIWPYCLEGFSEIPQQHSPQHPFHHGDKQMATLLCYTLTA